MRYNSREEVERIGRAGSCLRVHGDMPAWRYLSSFWLFVEERDEAFTPHGSDGFWEAWITKWMSEQFESHEYFIDVGANVGYYTLMAAKAGLITEAWEPNPAIVSMLNMSVILNRVADRVTVCPEALSDYNGHAWLTIPERHSGGASLASEGHVKVPVITFDNAYPYTKGKSILIKIDAEGEEPKIWAGMQDFWRRNDITVILEWETIRFDAEAFAKSILADGKNQAWYVDFMGREIPLVHWRQFLMLDGLQMVVVRKAS